MKKGIFKTRIAIDRSPEYPYEPITELKEVQGVISNLFAFYKSDINFEYQIIHLNTGCSIAQVDKPSKAWKIIKLLEATEFPVPWDKITFKNMNTEVNKNLYLTRKIINRD